MAGQTSQTGKNNIYLINSIPKQQPALLTQGAFPGRGVCACECVHTYALSRVHVYIYMHR